jgi:hypothetical protein
MAPPPFKPIEPKEMPHELRKLGVVLKDMRAGVQAIYRSKEGINGPELDVWGTLSLFAKTPEEHRQVAEALHPGALRCWRENSDDAIHPPQETIPDSEGRRWWNLVVGSGAARRAGYAISVMVPAKDREEAVALIAKIHAVFSEAEWERVNVPLGLPPVLERLRELLFRDKGAGGLAIYRVGENTARPALTLLRTLSPYAWTSEDHSYIGEIDPEELLNCCERGIDSETQPESPRNDEGRQWWNVLLGSGPVRKAGYALAVAVPAKDRLEAIAQIAKIQNLFSKNSRL